MCAERRYCQYNHKNVPEFITCANRIGAEPKMKLSKRKTIKILYHWQTTPTTDIFSDAVTYCATSVEHIERLRKSIADGTYRINSHALAASLLQAEEDFFS